MEKFFLIGCQVDEIELKELLLRRYGRFDFNEMKLDEFVEFVALAITNDRKDKIREEYFAWLPILIRIGHYMTFDQFYDERTGANIDWRPIDEIMKEVEEIQERFANGN